MIGVEELDIQRLEFTVVVLAAVLIAAVVIDRMRRM